MQTQNFINSRASYSAVKVPDRLHDSTAMQAISTFLHNRCEKNAKSWLVDVKIHSVLKTGKSDAFRTSNKIQAAEYQGLLDGCQGGLLDSEDDDEVCPVECVKEFKTDEELHKFLEKAKENDSLVVVDFFRTSCGSCKYIEQGFVKLCKRSGDQEAPVVFLKHNVIDEYDEQSEVAERLRIKTVPLFHFYKNGVLLEAFPTRDKEKILTAILKYTTPTSQDK